MKKNFKYILLAGLIVLIIFLIFNLKSIPNYSKKSGSEIVWKSNYEKYQEGYCLEENRILAEEEVFKKALQQYFEKSIIIDKKIEDYRVHSYGSRWKHYSRVDWEKYDFNETSLAYYALEDVDANNFNDKFMKYFDFKKKRTGLLELFFGKFKAKKVNPMDIVKINDREAYFPTVIIQQIHTVMFTVFKKFLLKKDGNGYRLVEITEGFPEDCGENNIKSALKSFENEGYKYQSKVDNCGNLDLDVEKTYESLKVPTCG